MNSPALVRFATLVLAAHVGVAAEPARDPNAPGQNAVPLIVIDEVPLVDAIRNIARQAGLNYILDPRLEAAAQTAVSIRRTNVSVFAVLDTVLKAHNLTLVTNPVTTVARIAPAKLGIRPVQAGQVGPNSGPALPLLVMDDVPLAEAIRKLAEAARLTVSLDLKSLNPSSIVSSRVSFRWEKLSARQALAALLDNYDLELEESTDASSARIRLKPPPEGIQIIR